MTRDEILNMPANKHLDKLIHLDVMNLPEPPEKFPCPVCGDTENMWYGETRSRCTICNEWLYSPYKQYSDDIAAAFQMQSVLFAQFEDYVRIEKKYMVQLMRVIVFDNGGEYKETLMVKANAHQRCRAALLVVMETE